MPEASQTKYDPANALHRGRLAHDLVTALEAKGFERSPRKVGEIVYRRQVSRVVRFCSVCDEPQRDFGELEGWGCACTPGAPAAKRYVTIPHVFVAVFTSIPSHGSLTVRESGKDAIRVCAIFDDGDRTLGLAKETRINRSGTIEGIIDRALERLRSCWSTATDRPLCSSCKGITFRSRAKNDVCAALCWK